MLAALPNFIDHWELESQLRSETVIFFSFTSKLIGIGERLYNFTVGQLKLNWGQLKLN